MALARVRLSFTLGLAVGAVRVVGHIRRRLPSHRHRLRGTRPPTTTSAARRPNSSTMPSSDLNLNDSTSHGTAPNRGASLSRSSPTGLQARATDLAEGGGRGSRHPQATDREGRLAKIDLAFLVAPAQWMRVHSLLAGTDEAPTAGHGRYDRARPRPAPVRSSA